MQIQIQMLWWSSFIILFFLIPHPTFQKYQCKCFCIFVFKFRIQPGSRTSRLGICFNRIVAADLLSSCLTSSVMGNQGKYKIYFDFFGFFISLPELRSMHVELYILKSKFGCHVPQSNLSYCHVNLVGDVGQTFDSLVSLCSHFGIANKKHPKKLSTKYFE